MRVLASLDSCSKNVSVLILAIALFLGLTLVGFFDNHSRELRLIVLPIIILGLALFVSTRCLAGERKDSDSHVVIYCLLAAAIALYVLVFFYMKILRVEVSTFDFFDAGLYERKIYRLSQLSLYEAMKVATLEAHFQPILLAYAALYDLFGGFKALLMLQSCFLASGALATFKLAQVVDIDKRSALIFGCTYLVHPALQFNDILGVLPDQLVIPLLIWAIYLLKAESYKSLIVVLAFLLTIGEAWMPAVAAFGVFIMCFERQKYLGVGIFLASLLCFIFVLFILLTNANSLNSGSVVFGAHSPYGAAMGGKLGELFEMLIHPRRLFFLLFFVFAFFIFPFAHKKILIVAFPDLVKTLLSTEPLHFSVEGHYTGVIYVTVLAATIFGTQAFVNKRPTVTTLQCASFVLIASIGLNIIHGPSPISLNFWRPWSAGNFYIERYMMTEKATAKRDALNMIPKDNSLRIQVSNHAYDAGFAKIQRLEVLPNSRAEVQDFDYVLVDSVDIRDSSKEIDGDPSALQYANLDRALRNSFLVLYSNQAITLYKNKRSKEN